MNLLQYEDELDGSPSAMLFGKELVGFVTCYPLSRSIFLSNINICFIKTRISRLPTDNPVEPTFAFMAIDYHSHYTTTALL